MDRQQHEMILEMTHASGMQGWYCPACGRRILLMVPPSSEMVVVDPGELYASHSGSTGGLRIGTVQINERGRESLDVSEQSLQIWIKAIEQLDLNW